MPYLGASGDVPGANIKSYRYKQGTDTSTGATSFPAVNKGADELRVYLNGALLKLTADYTFTTSAVTISPAPADDDEIQIDVYTSMNLADTVSSSDGGNFVGAVTFQAGVKTGSVKAQDGTSAITIADSTGKVTIPGDLEIQGTTTTIDTNVESVDKLEVGANSSDYAVSITQSGAGVGLDINGSELVLDADADTSIHASTDDQIDIKVGGTDKVTIDSTALKTDDIQEKTTDHGVEIEQVTLKDGGGTFTGNITTTGYGAIGTSTLTGGNVKLDLANTGSGAGTQIRFKNQHNTGFYIGQAGDTTGEVIIHNDGNTNMKFATNGDERLKIDNNGNIGIATGSATLTEKLRVDGATVVTGQLQNHQTSAMALHQTSATISEIRVYGADDSTAGKFSIRGYSNDGTPFYKGLAIDNAGNIAIGIDDPEKLLHLNHSTSPTIKFTNTTTGTGATAGVDIDVTGTSMTITNHEDGQFVYQRANGTDLFRVTTSAIDGIHINSRVVYTSGSDADTIFTPGMYRIDPNVSNIPSGHHYAMVVFGNGSNVTTQIATIIAGTSSYVRSYNTSWTSWSQFN